MNQLMYEKASKKSQTVENFSNGTLTGSCFSD